MPIINLVYEEPKWWKPWANTVAYYPFTSTSTVNDMSGNNRNLTNNGTQFWTYGWVDCAYLPRVDSKKLYWTLPLTWNQPFTFNVYINRQWNSYRADGSWQIFVLGNVWTSSACFWTTIIDSTSWEGSSVYNKYRVWTWWNDKTASQTNTVWEWNMITVTNNSWDVKLYLNWTQILNQTISFYISADTFTIGSFPTTVWSQYQWFYWYMSNFIVENKVRTAQDISDYYNQTKSNYGL